MKIALLGYGKEGQATENYFKSHFSDLECDIFDNFAYDEIKKNDFSSYDMVFRSPSVPPLKLPNETSMTKYFFDHCPCPIIGVTATKGKGTTCSFIESILSAFKEDVHLIGNIGNPAINVLDILNKESVVVFELSSFQLWDLKKPPHIAIIGTIEPDHLNVHDGYDDYLNAKANIGRNQNENDFLIYFKNNPDSMKLASFSRAQKIPYPFEIPEEVKRAVILPGKHNEENAVAAIAAVACYKNISPDELLAKNTAEIVSGISNFKGLPHRLEFLRELNDVKYYDDNFSTNPSSTKVAVNAFSKNNLVIIVGGRDKTDYEDLPEIYDILQAPQVKKIVLIGESGHELARIYQDNRFMVADSLEEAVSLAKDEAEGLSKAIVLMSPSAASFDMFENVYDRGDQFQAIVKKLS